MSDIVTTDPVSPEAVEHILGTGDLSKLTTHQRVEYYAAVCKSVGLNPLTRPFRFMSFQGQTVMYATRDCTDQLRQIRKISIAITDKRLDGDLFIVTAQATAADGRRDEDVGAVTIGKLMGEARANATMKALTKAKRRVTLSICGLGMLSEDEVETLPGAMTFDPESVSPAPLSPKQQRLRGVDARGNPWRSAEGEDADRAEAAERERAAAAPMPRPARKVADEPVDNSSNQQTPKTTPMNQRTDTQAEDAYAPTETPHDRWMVKLRAALDATTSAAEAEAVGERESVKDYFGKASPGMRRDITAELARGYGRHAGPQNVKTPDDLHIEGEQYAAAG
jgi:hypothetical protein